MVYYKPIKISIKGPELAEVIIDVLVPKRSLLDSIISDQGSVFSMKF